MRVICQVFKSLKKEGMFLYVQKSQGLSEVPEVLKKLFGAHKEVMTFLLVEGKAIAGVSSVEVIEAISEKGFYLQMPLAEEDEMRDIAEKNDKLAR